MKPIDGKPVQTMHTHKAMLTFTRDELVTLVEGLDRIVQTFSCNVGDLPLHTALRARVQYALDSLPPPPAVRT